MLINENNSDQKIKIDKELLRFREEKNERAFLFDQYVLKQYYFPEKSKAKTHIAHKTSFV